MKTMSTFTHAQRKVVIYADEEVALLRGKDQYWTALATIEPGTIQQPLDFVIGLGNNHHEAMRDATTRARKLIDDN